MKKYIIFTQDTMASTVASRVIINKHYQQIAAVVIAQQVKGESLIDRIKLAVKITGKSSISFLIYKIIESSGYITLLSLHKLFRTKKYSEGTAVNISDVADKYGIKIIRAGNLSSNEFLDRIKSMEPDYILCIVGQVLKKNVFDKLGNILLNVHGAYLPKYRGAAQYFWYLFNRDSSYGVTLHYMTPALDSGKMILRKKFHFNPLISAYRLHFLLGEKFGQTFNTFIEDIAGNKKISAVVQNESQATYLRMPTAKDVSEFHKLGHKLITLKDFLSCI